MNAIHKHAVFDLPFGAAMPGGFYAGRIRVEGQDYAVIVAPRALGEHADTVWADNENSIEGATSFHDGLANTKAMADAGSSLAEWALALQIGGYSDFYIPARDELELIYRNLKPTTQKNYVWRHGENPSSAPLGYPYTEVSPVQTAVEAFKAGGAEAFYDAWYWTSTQYAGSESYAWVQHFYVGNQFLDHKSDDFRARAVRRLAI